MNAKLIIPKSNSLEDLQEYLADCSSVVRDKQPKSAEKLWNRLLKESFGGTASRVFEYIPCTVNAHDHKEQLDCTSQLFGFITFSEVAYDYYTYSTTMRELLNWGWSVEDCLKVVDFTNYRTFKCETPYFIYGQLSTHNQITSVSHSQRYGKCDRGYWMPPEVVGNWHDNAEDNQQEWNAFVEIASPTALKKFMAKGHKITRKEVWDRGADMLQNRVFTLGGYTSNPNAFPHFIDQRLDSHTQKETSEFVQQLKDLI